MLSPEELYDRVEDTVNLSVDDLFAFKRSEYNDEYNARKSDAAQPGDEPLDDVQDRTISMIAVTKPLKVQWLVEGTVMQTKVLRPWIGRHTAPADVVIEAAVKQPRTRE